MTDAPTFGATFVGKKFKWAEIKVSDDPTVEDETIIHTFRARPKASLSFDETLAYNTAQSKLMLITQKRIAKLRAEAAAEEAAEEAAAPDPAKLEADWERVQAIADETVEEELDRWQLTVDQTLMLVHAHSVDAFRPLLAKGDPNAVRDLREWLISEVMRPVEQEVAAAAAVDPSLLPPPSSSPDSTNGGDSSESEAPPSTD
jgi:hypothetical protein